MDVTNYRTLMRCQTPNPVAVPPDDQGPMQRRRRGNPKTPRSYLPVSWAHPIPQTSGGFHQVSLHSSRTANPLLCHHCQLTGTICASVSPLAEMPSAKPVSS